jgi:hypothetical protein
MAFLASNKPEQSNTVRSFKGLASIDRTRLLTHIGVFLAYCFVAIIATYPLISQLSSGLVGGHGKMSNDRMQNIWNLWWVKEALTVRFTNPYTSDMLMYPKGVSLYLHTLTFPLGVLSIPVQWFFDMLATYNIMIMLTVVLAGYCTFVLARKVTGNTAAAFVAGIIMLTSPLRLGDIRLGLMPMLSDFGVPLTLWAVLHTLEKRSWRWAIVAAFFWLVAGLSMWYHFLNLAVLLASFAVWRWVAAWRRGDKAEIWADLRSWLLIGGLTAAMALPFLLPAMFEATTTHYARKPDTHVWSVTLDQLFPSFPAYLWEEATPEWTPDYLYALLPFGLMLLSLLVIPRKTALWVTLWFVCLLFSFGPSLTISLGTTSFSLPMPYAPLRNLPVIEGLRMPGRFTYVAILCISMAVATMIAHLAQWSSRPKLAFASLALSVVIALEAIRLPMAIVPTPISPFYYELAAMPDDFSVVEFPFNKIGHNYTEMEAQTIHGKRILTGQTSRDIPRMPYEAMLMFEQVELAKRSDEIISLDKETQDALLEALKVRYLIFWPDPFAEGRREQQIAVAQELLGPLELVYDGSDFKAYRLPERNVRPERFPLFLGRDDRWPEPEFVDGIATRWIDNEGSGLWTYVSEEREVALELWLYSLPGERPLEIWLNDELLMTLPIRAGLEHQRYLTAPFRLPVGTSLISLRAPEGGVSPASLGLGDDQRLLSFNIKEVQLHGLDEE